jgi:hypothetical protein
MVARNCYTPKTQYLRIRKMQVSEIHFLATKTNDVQANTWEKESALI